jgi:hypothetical protein
MGEDDAEGFNAIERLSHLNQELYSLEEEIDGTLRLQPWETGHVLQELESKLEDPLRWQGKAAERFFDEALALLELLCEERAGNEQGCVKLGIPGSPLTQLVCSFEIFEGLGPLVGPAALGTVDEKPGVVVGGQP